MTPRISRASVWFGTAAKAARYAFSLALLAAFWVFLVRVMKVSPGLLPPLEGVLASLMREWVDFYWPYAAATLSKALLGGAMGACLGLATGLFLGYSRISRVIGEPYLTIFQSFPREALYPLLVIALGVGDGPQITNAAMLSFFPVATTTLNAVSDSRRDYIDLVRSWGATRWGEFIHVRLPYAVPTLVGAIKLAAPFALIGAVLAEMLGGGTRQGLGNLIVSAQAGQSAISTYAAIIILAAIGLTLIIVIQGIDYLLLRKFRHE